MQTFATIDYKEAVTKVVFDNKPKISSNHRLLGALFLQRKRETCSAVVIITLPANTLRMCEERDKESILGEVCSETFLTSHASSCGHEYPVNSNASGCFRTINGVTCIVERK